MSMGTCAKTLSAELTKMDTADSSRVPSIRRSRVEGRAIKALLLCSPQQHFRIAAFAEIPPKPHLHPPNDTLSRILCTHSPALPKTTKIPPKSLIALRLSPFCLTNCPTNCPINCPT